MFKDIYFLILQYLYLHPFLVPLGLIGMWRWSTWLFKEVVALKYTPQKGTYKEDVSIVTPVYNEDPKVFLKALESWKKNKPKEIIAVIDHSDKKCIGVFRKFVKKNRRLSKLIVTKVAGKRPALATGIKKAKSEIVALVDSDTLWEDGVLKNGLAPFKDKKVAGVGTYQSVLHPKTLAQKIFDTQLDLRYHDEMPFLAAAGDALVCLSGRTAFYRRKVIKPMLSDLVNETFLGKKVISGDDKRLTYLVLEAGWKVRYQANSHVYTPGMEDLKSYLRQRLRWTRNGIRADLKALKNGWPMKHPALLFFQLDKFAQALVIVLSPIYFTVSLLTGLWQAAVVIAVWWIVSRLVKMYPHLKRRPQDLIILPAFIIYTFLTAIIKVYAVFTLNTQGWITRWGKDRLQNLRFIQLAPGYAATISLLILLGIGVFLIKEHTYFEPREKQMKIISQVLPSNEALAEGKIQDNNMGPSVNEEDLRVKKYIVKSGDSLGSIALQFGINPNNLLYANIARLTNWNTIEPGMILNIPGKAIELLPSYIFNYRRIYDDILNISYDETSKIINVTGRGKEVTLSDISQSYPQYVKQIKKGEWFVTRTIFIRSGVTLNLDSKEVKWLKLQSNSKTYATLRANSGNIFINGVKITSWDDGKNDYDKNINDGRSFILVKDGSRMDISSSELAFLGFPRAIDPNTSPYGVSWRMSNGKLKTTVLTGEITNSRFHNNYFGAYTFGATGMLWRGNEFYDNIRYGLDPHDDSNGFLVEGNKAHNNGSHGIIFSKRCINNVIRNNISYNNKLHGIMLHEKSSHNLLENNTLYGNTDGIALWHSSSNLIKNNKIDKNRNGIRADAASSDNLITRNIIRNSALNGIYFYGNSNNNIVYFNSLSNSHNAIYLKSANNKIANNLISDNRVGVYFLGDANKNEVLGNKISYSSQYGIYAKVDGKHKNELKGNNLRLNRLDIAASLK